MSVVVSKSPTTLKALWRGKEFAELNTEELTEAVRFYQKVLDEVQSSSPMAVWGFFSKRLADLTLLSINRQ